MTIFEALPEFLEIEENVVYDRLEPSTIRQQINVE